MKPFWLVLGFLGFIVSPIHAVDTTITGGRMELKEKGETVYFSDGVKLDRGNDSIKAREMKTNKTRNKVNASGRVEFFRRVSATETCVGYGDNAYYASDSGEGYVVGTSTWAHLVYSRVISSTITQRMDIFARRFDFMKANSAVVGTNSVYGKTLDPETNDTYTFWSDTAHYDGENKLVILKGPPQPQVFQVNGEEKKVIQGNILTYHIDTKKFDSEGQAQAVFFDPSSPIKKRGN